MTEVYKALGEILASLSVEKGAVLPSNMGGKPYITAVDLSLEIKRKFVDKNLILLPQEREVSKELVVTPQGRITVTLSVEGTYTIVSTKDGSQAVISGAGDGLASGSAVASNIASTNALKNALLRTFLVTEQSVEEAAKSGPVEEATTPAARKISAAATKAEAKASEGVTPEIADLQAKVRKFITDKTFTSDQVNKLGAKYAKEAGKPKFVNTDKDLLEKVVAGLEAGEVA